MDQQVLLWLEESKNLPRWAPPPGEGKGVGNSQPQGCTASAGQTEVEVEYYGASQPSILVGASSQQRPQQQKQQKTPQEHQSSGHPSPTFRSQQVPPRVMWPSSRRKGQSPVGDKPLLLVHPKQS